MNWSATDWSEMIESLLSSIHQHGSTQRRSHYAVHPAFEQEIVRRTTGKRMPSGAWRMNYMGYEADVHVDPWCPSDHIGWYIKGVPPLAAGRRGQGEEVSVKLDAMLDEYYPKDENGVRQLPAAPPLPDWSKLAKTKKAGPITWVQPVMVIAEDCKLPDPGIVDVQKLERSIESAVTEIAAGSDREFRREYLGHWVPGESHGVTEAEAKARPPVRFPASRYVSHVTCGPLIPTERMRLRLIRGAVTFDVPVLCDQRRWLNAVPHVTVQLYRQPCAASDGCVVHLAIESDSPEPWQVSVVESVAPAPADPLDVEYDGVSLRDLLEMSSAMAQERKVHGCVPWRNCDPWTWTPAQRAAISAHWSAQLRAKVAASAAADHATATRTTLDADPEDYPW